MHSFRLALSLKVPRSLSDIDLTYSSYSETKIFMSHIDYLCCCLLWSFHLDSIKKAVFVANLIARWDVICSKELKAASILSYELESWNIIYYGKTIINKFSYVIDQWAEDDDLCWSLRSCFTWYKCNDAWFKLA